METLLDVNMEGGFAVVRDGDVHVGEITLRFDQGDLEVIRDVPHPSLALRWTTGERANELGELVIHLSEDNARELAASILEMLGE